MKYTAIIAVCMLIFCTVTYFSTRSLGAKVRIRGQVFTVDTAITEPQKQKGLAGRHTLLPKQGMLFVYDHKEQYEFWMRGMQFPLDFVWIDTDTVVDITTNVPPPKNSSEKPAIVMPAALVDKILELNAGSVEKYGIEIGDQVEFIDK